MDFKRKLPLPMETKAMYPLEDDMIKTVEERTAELKDIIAGRSEKIAPAYAPTHIKPACPRLSSPR